MEEGQQGTGNFPVLQIARAAYRDTWRAFRAMSGLVFATFALLVLTYGIRGAFGFLQDPFVRHASPENHEALDLATQLFYIANSLVTAPLQIAIHRYVLLEDADLSCQFLPIHQRSLKYVTILIFIQLVFFCIGLLDSGWFILIGIVLNIGAIYLSVRASAIFPAIAIDSPGNVLSFCRLTRGWFWRIFGVFFICSFPLMLLVLPAAAASYLGLGHSEMTVLLVPLYAVFVLVFRATWAAAASHVYRVLERFAGSATIKLDPATVEQPAS
jgi:hypothetical protein